ncbi:MAG: DUF4124 domain-containing protein [Woeseiaceae bacterium]
MKYHAVVGLFLLTALPADADVEIHKCVDADGNIAYQQTPCPVIKEPDPEEQAEEEVAVVEEVEPTVETQPAPVVSNKTHEEIETCKDPLRDAIDAIEAEMLAGFSPEEGEEFKAKLRTLTQEMRACG